MQAILFMEYLLEINNGIIVCFGISPGYPAVTITLPITYTTYIAGMVCDLGNTGATGAMGNACCHAQTTSTMYVASNSTQYQNVYWYTIGF